MNEHHSKDPTKEYTKKLSWNYCGKCHETVSSPHHCIYQDEPREDKTVTQLLNKNLAPMIIRKYQGFGWPLFIALICDADLSGLDDIVMGYVGLCDPKQMNSIQDLRNFCGNLSDAIVDAYNGYKFGCVEGVGVIAYWDKCLCSSLYGDHMTHGQCRVELFQLLNMMTNM